MPKTPTTLDPIFTAPTWPGVRPMSRHVRALRGDNAALAKALHELPGFTEANAALHAFAKQAEALAGEPVPTAADRATVLAARLLAGERPGADALRDEIAKDAAASLAAEGAREIVSQTGGRLLYEREEILTAQHDEIAAGLTRQFRAVIDKARTAGVTTATLDAADVLRREALAEGKALDEATAAYREIRAALTAFLGDYRVSVAHSDASTDDYWTAVTLVDPLGIDRWHPATSGQYQVRNESTGEIIRKSSLPNFRDADQAREIVAWLAEHDEAEVWVPSGPKASTAVQRLTRARTEAAAAAARRIPLRVQRGPFGNVRTKWGAAESTGWQVSSATGTDNDGGTWIVQREPESLITNA